MRILIGDTGLVGTTLKNKIDFDLTFNSSNINTYSIPTNGDLYLACLPAAKYLVNKNLIKDISNITSILEKIKSFNYNKVILFSTIDVYGESPDKSNEDTIPTIKSINYGSNRYLFELLIQQELSYKSLQIIRLPGLFGKNLKKNIIFDLINKNNLDKINAYSIFQWYPLDDLYLDLTHTTNITTNFFTEPLQTEEIVERFFPELRCHLNYQSSNVVYNYKTKTTDSGYWRCKNYVLKSLERFLSENRNK